MPDHARRRRPPWCAGGGRDGTISSLVITVSPSGSTPGGGAGLVPTAISTLRGGEGDGAALGDATVTVCGSTKRRGAADEASTPLRRQLVGDDRASAR